MLLEPGYQAVLMEHMLTWHLVDGVLRLILLLFILFLVVRSSLLVYFGEAHTALGLGTLEVCHLPRLQFVDGRFGSWRRPVTVRIILHYSLNDVLYVVLLTESDAERSVLTKSNNATFSLK